MRRTLTLGLSLAVLAMAAGAAPAATPSVSPAAPSDAVLAAHPDPGGELQVRYQQDVDGRQQRTITVALARGYDEIETPAERTIHDYQLRRVLRFQPAFVASYVNDSLYAEVWQRAAEAQRRATESGPVAQAGIAPVKGQLTLAPFWAESELGLINPTYPRPLALQRSQDGDRTRWTLDGQEVAAVRWQADPVPAPLRPGLRRFWPVLAPVHPVIADELAASGKLPEELWVTAPGPDHRHLVHLHWKRESRQWVPGAPYPLAPHLQALPTDSTGAYPQVFATLVNAVDRHLTPPPENVYLEKMQGAISAGDGLQALIWQMELRLAAGPPPPECTKSDRRPVCQLGQVAASLAGTDDRTDLAMAPQSPPLKDRPAFLDLPNGYLLRLMWATRPPGAKVTFAESERGVLEALNASPVANFAKDAGDFYAGAFKARPAWQIYDLGRLMTGHRLGDLLDEVDSLEQRLARSYPGLF